MLAKIRSITAPAAVLVVTAACVLGTVGVGTASATGYGPYLTLASPSLNVRSAPSTSATVVGSLPYHSTISIACQTSGSLVVASTVWDRLTNGYYVSDYWTNTPAIDTFTSTIPRCDSTSTGGTPTAAVGRTVGYNEGASGQCTWWAINEFHAYDGRYPNLIDPANNGNAGYWATNAVYNGWTLVATPRVNAIAVFLPYVNGAGAVGHVAWVTGVSGSTIRVSEMNFTYGPGNIDTRTLTPAASVRYILAP
jgi:surface antigen